MKRGFNATYKVSLSQHWSGIVDIFYLFHWDLRNTRGKSKKLRETNYRKDIKTISFSNKIKTIRNKMDKDCPHKKKYINTSIHVQARYMQIWRQDRTNVALFLHHNLVYTQTHTHMAWWYRGRVSIGKSWLSSV